MIELSGYYSTIRLTMDDAAIEALFTMANRHNDTPDHVIEQLVGALA